MLLRDFVKYVTQLKLGDFLDMQERPTVFSLFHDLLLRSYLYHCVWSVITAHNLTPEKRDSLTPTSCL